MAENSERPIAFNQQKFFSIPQRFCQNISKAFGKSGEEWLLGLPSILEWYCKEWALSIGQPMGPLNWNYVVPAVLPNSDEVVLKAGVPRAELSSEIDALNAFAGRKVVKLLQSNKEDGVLLLEHIRPGNSLVEIQQQDDLQATKIAASVMGNLPAFNTEAFCFSSVSEWMNALCRIQEEEISAEVRDMLDKANHIFHELDQSKRQVQLLHGDLHYENILFDEKKGWIAIDPKGVIGDPDYETARLLHNPIPELLKAEAPQERIEKRIDILASKLNRDRDRIVKWGYVDCLLAASWSREEGGGAFQYLIDCAKIFEKIMVRSNR